MLKQREEFTVSKDDVLELIDQLDEPDSDYAYQKGFREGVRQTAEYFESVTEEPSYAQVQKYLSEHGIKIADKEPETIADVVTTFWKSYERLKEVMSREVEGMGEWFPLTRQLTGISIEEETKWENG